VLKRALAISCAATVIASGYLSLSLLILGPPRGNLTLWFLLAALLVAQSAMTLAAITMPQPPVALLTVVLAGALGLFAIAIWRVRATLTSSHFEGYNLLLGAMLVAQGALTLMAVRPFRSSPPVLSRSH
jgi:hypothetical protein